MCRETLKGEARAGNTRGERGKEVCIRASDARCAGMPNLGSSGLDRGDLIPQLCAASCCWQRTLASEGLATDCQLDQRSRVDLVKEVEGKKTPRGATVAGPRVGDYGARRTRAGLHRASIMGSKS